MKQRTVSFPSDWSEMTPEDMREVLKMRQEAQRRHLQLSAEDVRLETARLLLKNRGVPSQPNNLQWLTLITQLADTLTWLWKDTEEGIMLEWHTTEQLLERVQYGTGRQHTVLLGPKSHGTDMTFGEFRMAAAIMKDYRLTGNEQALCVLAGLLYRPAATERQKTEHGDRQMSRQPYDWDDVNEKERRGRRMKPWQRTAAVLWLQSLCETLTEGVFNIEGRAVSFAPLFGSGQTRTDTDSRQSQEREGDSSMQQICLTLAETHVFGTVKDVDRAPLLTVMQKLLMDYETLQRLKKK